MTSRRQTVLLLVPACLILALLTIVPGIGVIVLSFLRWTQLHPPTPAGIANFTALFTDQWFSNALRVSLIFVSLASLIEVTLGLAIALLLENWPKVRNGVRLLLTLPLVLSPAIAGIVWKLALDEQSGPFMRFLRLFWGDQVRPLSSPTGAVATLVAIDVWQWTPFVVLLLSIALEGFKKRYEDLVKVDQLSWVAAFRFVWMPLILPTIGIAALFRVVDCLKVFDIVQTATAGGPGSSTEVLSLYTYKNLIKFGNYGYAATTALVLLVLAAIVFFLASKLFFNSWTRKTSWPA